MKQVVKWNAATVKFFQNLLVFLSAQQGASKHCVLDSYNHFLVHTRHDVLVASSCGSFLHTDEVNFVTHLSFVFAVSNVAGHFPIELYTSFQ